MQQRNRACVLGLFLAVAVGQASAAVCPSPLTLVEQLSDASIFAEVLAALGSDPSSAGASDGKPTGGPAPLARRLLTSPMRPCPRIYSPVCGKDGATYDNECLAGGADAVACEGACPCKPDATTSGNGDAAAKPCPRIYSPVCGKDSTTYDNECLAGGADAVACEGACPCPTTPRNEDAAATPCPLNYLPVCGDDGVTYGNECMAGGAGASVACEGACPCKPDASSATSGDEDAAATPCPLNYLPVCGDDGVTYDNECLAGGTESVACEGACPCASPTSDDGSEVEGEPEPVACFSLWAPVCGTDGKTYSNSCRAASEGAEVACNGECPCPDLLQALKAGGGLLLVPTDDSLLAELEAFNTTDGSAWMSNIPLLKQLVTRHIILTQNQMGMTKELPHPTKEGTPATTEAGQQLKLFSYGSDSTQGYVSLGADQPEESRINILDYVKGCEVAVALIDAPLLS